MNKRKMRLRDHGISRWRQMELKGFCRQYSTWKQEVENHAYVSSMTYKMTPGNPNKGTTDMTGNTAVKLLQYQKNIELVESVAKEAGGELWEYILKSACEGKSFEEFEVNDNIPISRGGFYDRKRMFFYILDRRKDDTF